MLKRRLGSVLRARSSKSQCRQTILRAIAHNGIIIRKRVFYSGFLFPQVGSREMSHVTVPIVFEMSEILTGTVVNDEFAVNTLTRYRR